LLDTIKSYLVSLGFKVDDKSFNDVTRSMDSVERQVGKFAGTSVTKFAQASAAVTSFVAAAVFGIGKFLDSLGKADIENEKLARQLWTTEQSAMSFNATLKAMGVSLEDLYLSPTLMSQFKQLRGEAAGLQAPAEYKEQMRTIQGISFEFKRMKLEATYALQWIGYYLIKYLDGPLKGTKKALSNLNDTIVKTMPQWTKRIAQVMSWFVQMGVTLVRGVQDIGRAFDWLGKLIPDNLKIIASAAASIGLIIASGPFGILAASILAVILLLDDFYTYIDGGESALGPLWQKLIDFKDELDASGQLDALRENLSLVFDSVNKVLDALGEILMTLTGTDSIEDAMIKIGQISFDALIETLKVIAGLFETIAESIEIINGFMKEDAAKKVIAKGQEAQKSFSEKKDRAWWDIIWDGIKDGPFSDNAVEMRRIDGGITMDTYYKIKEALFGPSGDGNFGYTLPAASTTNNNNNSKVEINQTNNVYGSDPQATAGVIDQNLADFMRDYHWRGLQGVIK